MKISTATFALGALLCLTGTPLAQTNSPSDFGTVRRSGILTDIDQVQDFSLPGAFRITGTVSGDSPTSVAATRTDGTVFPGAINTTTRNYAIPHLPAGDYTLRWCSGTTATATFDDPNPVMVTMDTVRDEVLPSVMTFNVSGTVTGLDPTAFASINFGSQDGRTGGSGFVIPGGTYSANLPNGIYNVVVVQFDFATMGAFFFPVGSVTVSDAAVMMNFDVGPRAQLSGTVIMPMVPPNSNMFAFGSVPSGTGFNCSSSSPAGGTAPADPGTGAYAMTLLTGRNYFLMAFLPVLAADPPQSTGVWTWVDPMRVDFVGDTMRDVVVNVPPDTVAITGQVTALASAGFGNAPFWPFHVFASCRTPGAGIAPPSTFSRSTQTDAANNYRLVVPRGLTCEMAVMGPPATP